MNLSKRRGVVLMSTTADTSSTNSSVAVTAGPSAQTAPTPGPCPAPALASALGATAAAVPGRTAVPGASVETSDNCDVVCIAIDGSSQAEEAFAWYTRHLHRPDNTVILIHAQEVPSIPTRDSWETQMSAGKDKRQALVDKYNAKFNELGMKGQCVVDMEKPGVLVVDVAKREGAAYVVMGTRGLGKIRRTVMGSVSDYVVHHAHCPVIVCRQ